MVEKRVNEIGPREVIGANKRHPKFSVRVSRDGNPLPVIAEAVGLQREVRSILDAASTLMKQVEHSRERAAGVIAEMDALIERALAIGDLCRQAAVPASLFEITFFLSALIEVKRKEREVSPMFGSLLITDVSSMNTSIGALEQACREIRMNSEKPFLPDISEICAAIRVAERDVSTRVDRLGYLALYRRKLAEIAGQVQRASGRSN